MLHLPAVITKRILVDNPHWTFVYGCCVHYHTPDTMCPEHICQGLPNCIGIPVRYYHCPFDRNDSFFRDYLFEIIQKIYIDKALAEIKGRAWVFPKIGLGCSQLDTKSPKTYRYIIERLNELCVNKLELPKEK